ncbi:cation efflux family-domain-containing protein [Obelidium mucronatum]|nr:cation efflux family-domain-containing protein [Obelidium mucronatum]
MGINRPPLARNTAATASTNTLIEDSHPIEIEDIAPQHSSKAGVAKSLWAALILCFVFFLVELVAGWWCGSLAILSDSFHLLSDVVGFGISLWALAMSQCGATKNLSFGYKRLEVLGACFSTMLLWIITLGLVFEAIPRLYHPTPIDVQVMFYTAAFGVMVNIALACTLSFSGLDHHHDDDDHHHHHHHHRHHDESSLISPIRGESPSNSLSSDEATIIASTTTPLLQTRNQNYESLSQQSSVIQTSQASSSFSLIGFLKMDGMDINMKSAVIHVISDLISSLGVLTASILLSINPEWTFVDPICTFFFSIMVFASTYPLMKRCILILMEATPQTSSITTAEIRSTLLSQIPQIQAIDSLHVWSISQDTHACMLSVSIDSMMVQESCLVVRKDRKPNSCVDSPGEVGVVGKHTECCCTDLYDGTVQEATRILKESFDFDYVNVQVLVNA